MHFVLATLLCTMCVSLTSAQEEAPEPELAYVYVDHVKPSMIEHYEAGTKEVISEFAAHGVDPTKLNFMVVSGPEIGYVYFMPLENFATLDAKAEYRQVLVQVVGEEKWKEMVGRPEKAVEYRECLLVVRRPDLSYVPEKPRLKEADVQFMRYTFFYVIPGQEERFEEVAKEFAALYKRHDIDTGWSVFKLIMGTDLPVYIVVGGARSPSDYFAKGEEIESLLGEEGERLGLAAMSFVRKLERKTGRPRPDLSYPKTTAEEE